MEFYGGIVDAKKDLNLDSDDANQYCAARYFGPKIVTMDKDLEKTKDMDILFSQKVIAMFALHI